MIKTEIITINGVQFQKTWSDANYLIERDGAKYSEAVDPIDIERTYTETTELIDPQDNITGDEILSMLEEVL